jgi:FkbM family methyltransferase
MIIWLASYPRSGNTMLRILLRSVFDLKTFSKHDDTLDIRANPQLIERLGHRFLEKPWSDAYPEMVCSDELNLVKTHDLPEDSGKAIYIARDGRTACHSYFHYLRDFGLVGDGYSLCDVVAGVTASGSWADHLDAWDPLNRPNTLFLKYEDLIAQPEQEIRRIGEFLNLSPIRKWQNDFAEMKKLDPRFFRAGTANNPNTALEGKEADIFDAVNSDWMERLNYAAPSRPVGQDTWRTYRRFASTKGKEHFQLLNRLNGTERELREVYGQANSRALEISELQAEMVVRLQQAAEDQSKLRQELESARQQYATNVAVKDEAIHSLAAATRELDTRLRMLLTSRLLRFGWRLGFGSVPYWDDPARDELTGLADKILKQSTGPAPMKSLPSTDLLDRALQHLNTKGFKPKVILDIGAAKGLWSRRAALQWPDAQMFMIDPLQESEASLQQLCQQPRFHYILTAVGNEPGEAMINLTQDYDGSTMLEFPNSDAVNQRRIPVMKIDDLLIEGRLQLPDLVKIDVQGFEIQAMEGGHRMFDTAQVFILEVSLFRFMIKCPRLDEVVRYMADRGFYIFDVAGMLRRSYQDDLGQMDLVFVSERSPMVSSNRWF